MKKVTFLNVLRGIGVTVSLQEILVWLVYIFTIPNYLLLQPIEVRQTFAELLPFPLVMIVLSMITTWASVKAKPRVLVVFSVLAFFSGGYYLLNANGWYRLSGILSLLLVLVAFRLAGAAK